MTEPGFIYPPPPGWWGRTDRIGTADTDLAVESSTTGRTPPVDLYAPLRSANPMVGSMAMRRNFRRKPQASRRKFLPNYESQGTPKHGSVASNGSFTIAHTIGSSSTALVVWVNLWTGGYTNTRMTAAIGAQNLTVADYTINFNNDGTFGGIAYLFTLLNPPTGAQTITVTLNTNTGATNYCSANSFAYTDVGGFGTVTKGNVGTGTPSLAVASAVGDLIFNGWADYTVTHASYNQTQRWLRPWTASTGFSTMVGDAIAASTSTTFSTAQTATTHCIMGLPLQPIT